MSKSHFFSKKSEINVCFIDFMDFMSIEKYRNLNLRSQDGAHKQNGQVRCSSDKEQKSYWTPSSWENWALFKNNFLLLELRVQRLQS